MIDMLLDRLTPKDVFYYNKFHFKKKILFYIKGYH